MKCKKCGYVARTLAGMAAHYRKKHPTAMKRGRGRVRSPSVSKSIEESPSLRQVYGRKVRYCPMCGQPF